MATGPTFPVHAPTKRIDHVLADAPRLAAATARTVDTGLSDHRAVVVDPPDAGRWG